MLAVTLIRAQLAFRRRRRGRRQRRLLHRRPARAGPSDRPYQRRSADIFWRTSGLCEC